MGSMYLAEPMDFKNVQLDLKIYSKFWLMLTSLINGIAKHIPMYLPLEK